MHPILRIFLIGLSYLALSIIYIHPGEKELFNGSTTSVLSDGTDPTAASYQFLHIKDLLHKNPTQMLYGAVPSPNLNAPEGFALWIPMIDRIYVSLFSFFAPVEQITTLISLVSIILNAFFMYILARLLQIPRIPSWGAGVLWGISAYTRARAKVHVGLVGIYHLPLLFIALLLISKNKNKNYLFASLIFLFISFLPHYYIIILSVLSPLYLIFLWLKNQSILRKKLHFVLLSLVPAILWLAWSLYRPVPINSLKTTSLFPETGMTQEQYHPFLDMFGASPLDYFSGDIGIGPKDLNPIKEKLNLYWYERGFDQSNPHERSLGVRWILWALLFVSFIMLWKNKFPENDKKIVLFFYFFAFFSFWLSLPPNMLGIYLSPSYWVHKFIPQIRVPNRAGIGVAFSLILIAGLVLKNLKPSKIISVIFILFIFLELPPYFQNMPISPILPKAEPLTEIKECGFGFRYPYVSESFDPLSYYYFLQQMRGSKCYLLNAATLSTLNIKMAQSFSWPNIEKKPLPIVAQKLSDFSNCAGISWLLFSAPLKENEAQGLCELLQWNWHSSGACTNPQHPNQLTTHFQSCLNLLTP